MNEIELIFISFEGLNVIPLIQTENDIITLKIRITEDEEKNYLINSIVNSIVNLKDRKD